MNSLTSLSRIMQRPSSSSTGSAAAPPAQPVAAAAAAAAAPQAPPSRVQTSVSALAAAAAAGDEDDPGGGAGGAGFPYNQVQPGTGGPGGIQPRRLGPAQVDQRLGRDSSNGANAGGGGGGGAQSQQQQQQQQRPGLGMRGAAAGAPPPISGLPSGNPMGLVQHDDEHDNGGYGGSQFGGGAGGRKKPIQYDFRYDDSDTLLRELSEFFAYSENEFLPDLIAEFQESFRRLHPHDDHDHDHDHGDDHDSSPSSSSTPWTSSTPSFRRSFLILQLESLESRRTDSRLSAAKTLLYLCMGSFAECQGGPEEQLHWVMENARAVVDVNGTGVVVAALQEAMRRHDAMSAHVEPLLPGQQPPDSHIELFAPLNAEISLYLGILYFLVEVHRSSDDESFSDALMALAPPLPILLLEILAGLRDKPLKDFPAKKLLLLLWKTLLVCHGGLKEVKKAVALQRDLAGLSPIKEDFTKVTPTSLAHFRRDVSVKYPTFEPESSSGGGTTTIEKLAEAVQPIPIRTGYHSSHEQDLPRVFLDKGAQRSGGVAGGPANPGGLPQPGTPAPSPPPTPPPPKPKKQQYQTDQTRPFVFPFSRSDAASGSSTGGGVGGGSGGRLVPFAIDEADKLYGRHMHVTLGLHQMHSVRNDFIREESGLGSVEKGLIGFTDSELPADEFDEYDDDPEWSQYQLQDWKYGEQEEACREQGDVAAAQVAQQARLSLKRLYRIELLYRSILPASQSIVVVLLKHLLATVTATAPNEAGSGAQPGESDPHMNSPSTIEELDVTRHREITSKAISGILLLMLKWFKASHIMKFQHLALLLIDSNALLLLLKLLGFAELPTVVASRNDKDELDLFNYCEAHFALGGNGSSSSPALHSSATSASALRTTAAGEDIEMVTDYSWRNFFYVINFVRILHQLTKQRPARITLLVQYKASQILKRMLRVPHPRLQLEILKVIKSQVPLCGRKWRQLNMKTITAIYLNCKPELRDEWLAAADIDVEIEESQAAETALRSLVRFYHQQHYMRYIGGGAGGGNSEAMHRRSASLAMGAGSGFEDLSISHGGPHHHMAPSMHRSDSDVFPPNRTSTRRTSNQDFGYNVDGIIGSFLYEYEDLISEVLGTDESGQVSSLLAAGNGGRGPALGKGDPAWMRLNEIMRGRGLTDDRSEISDSESIVSIGELDDGRSDEDESPIVDGEAGAGVDGLEELDSPADLDPEARRLREEQASRQRRRSGNENTWEHISPSLARLSPGSSPGSRPRRRSSGGPISPLRSVIGDGLGAGGAGWLDQPIEDDEEDEPGPMPIEEGTEDEIQRGNMAVDEVEAFFHV